MTHQEAIRELALGQLRFFEAHGAPSLQLLEEETKEYPRGTLFFWNSAEYVKTGEVGSQLAGNGPFFITREGEVFHLPTHEPWEKSLSKLGLDKARGQASIFDI